MHQKRRRPKVDKDRKEATFFTPNREREKKANNPLIAFRPTNSPRGRTKAISELTNEENGAKRSHYLGENVEAMIQQWTNLQNQLTQEGEHGHQCRSRCRELGRRELGSNFQDCTPVLTVLKRLTEHLATLPSVIVAGSSELKSKKESKTGGEICFKELLETIALPELMGNTNAHRDGETQLARWQRFLELLPQHLPRKPRVITGSPIHRHYQREEEVAGGVENFLRRLGRNFRFLRSSRNDN